MSSPKKTRTPQSATQENLLGLTANEARLLLLGVMYMDDAGKIDFEKLHVKAGVSLPSARTMFSRTKKKLIKLHPEGTDTDTPATTPKKAPKPRGRKRKHDSDEPGLQSEFELPELGDGAQAELQGDDSKSAEKTELASSEEDV